MPKRKQTEDVITELRKLLADKKLIIGRDRTLKNLRIGKLKKVFIASNCPDELKKDLKYYCSIGNIGLVELNYHSEEMGTVCKKPFLISVVGAVA